MTLVGSRYATRQVDVTTLPEPAHTSYCRLHMRLGQERVPEDPPTPLHVVQKRFRRRPAVMDATEWIVTEGDEVVAAANVVRWTQGSNPLWRDAWIGVLPEHRRRGIASSLVRRIVEAAAGQGDLVFGSDANDRVPAGAAFHERIGARPGLSNRKSQAALAEVDRALMREWASIDPAGYRLVWVSGDVPDELMANAIVAYDAMNTAPRGDLQFGDWHTTADEIRDWERLRRSSGYEQWLILAIHEATGETAGFTQVQRHPDIPWEVKQQGTAVVPAHRGHGIGKWMKAEMVERILREWADATFIRTGNAYSNAPMLSINDRMGFRTVWSVVVWQSRHDDLVRYLEGRGL
ncbi:MAG: GNAT family N-acetyltransferase [Chloroflexi bacterium]|nr:GNAT family N-acetyltransferase [Chloroflexota bacterium]